MNLNKKTLIAICAAAGVILIVALVLVLRGCSGKDNTDTSVPGITMTDHDGKVVTDASGNPILITGYEATAVDAPSESPSTDPSTTTTSGSSEATTTTTAGTSATSGTATSGSSATTDATSAPAESSTGTAESGSESSSSTTESTSAPSDGTAATSSKSGSDNNEPVSTSEGELPIATEPGSTSSKNNGSGSTEPSDKTTPSSNGGSGSTDPDSGEVIDIPDASTDPTNSGSTEPSTNETGNGGGGGNEGGGGGEVIELPFVPIENL